MPSGRQPETLLIFSWGNRAGVEAAPKGSQTPSKGIMGLYLQTGHSNQGPHRLRPEDSRYIYMYRSQHPAAPQPLPARSLPEGPRVRQCRGQERERAPALARYQRSQVVAPKPEEETTLVPELWTLSSMTGESPSCVQPVLSTPGLGTEVPMPASWGMETLQAPSRPVQEPGVEQVSQAMAAHHTGSPSLLAAVVIRLFSRRFRRRALRLLISST